MSEPSNNQRWATIYHTITGITAPGHHDAPTGTSEDSLKAGHEPDRFDAKGIIFVPIFVVVVTFLAYLVVTGVFSWIKPGKPNTVPDASPQAVVNAQKSFNDRAGQISSLDPDAPVKQPRLEGVITVKDIRESTGQPDPVNYRSFEPKVEKNTYYVTPQDLYPGKFVDPLTGEKLLDEWKPIGDKHARIPVEEAMKLLMSDAKFKGKLKAIGKPLTVETVDAPRQSNGGQVGK